MDAKLMLVGRDALINIAGALFNPRQTTPEGFEKSFALLLLGPFILTERLHPLLAAARHSRMVNVLSGGMYSQRIRVRDLQSERAPAPGPGRPDGRDYPERARAAQVLSRTPHVS